MREIRDIRIDIKPLSVNDAWQGRRFKTQEYKAYETEMLLRLPNGQLPPPPYRIVFEFGFSRKECDYDNPLKPLGDILQKKYHFNDNQIYEVLIRKKIVPKKKEYIDIHVETLNLPSDSPSKTR